MTRYSLAVTLQEDLHSGTGTAGATFDSVQIRDRHGRPTIRGTHIKGLLRAAADELVDLTEKGSKDRLALTAARAALFGERGAGGRGALTVRSLRLDKAGDTLAWTSSARRLGTRGPLDDTLRRVEHVPAGTRFIGALEVADGVSGKLLNALLRDCVKRVANLGSQRSRGVGAVTTALSEIKRTARAPLCEPQTNRLGLRLLLAPLDPLCLPITGVPGNIIPTETVIRGQALKGALAGWLIRHGKDPKDLLEGVGVSIGDALPLPVEPRTAAVVGADALSNWDVMPSPLDLRMPKPAGQKRVDWPWWAEVGNDRDEATGSKRPTERDFLFRPESQWQRYRIAPAVHLRTAVPTADKVKQDLFSVEELPEDTVFMADLVFPDRETAKRLRQALLPVLTGESWLTIGRGGTPVEIVRAVWRNAAPVPTRPSSTAQHMRILLTSDLIARGPTLGFYDRLTPEVLVDLLFPDSTTVPANLKDVAWEYETASDTVEVRGFNAVSGLPRPAALALRRGSALTVEGPQDATRTLMTQLGRRFALGERMAEGFGRFRLNDGVSTLPTAAPPLVVAVDEVKGGREALFDKAAKIVNGLVQTKGGPSITQWRSLWCAASIADDPAKVVRAYQGDAATRLGGQVWKVIDLTPLAEALEAAKPTDAQGLVDIVIRLLLVKLEGDQPR